MTWRVRVGLVGPRRFVSETTRRMVMTLVVWSLFSVSSSFLFHITSTTPTKEHLSHPQSQTSSHSFHIVSYLFLYCVRVSILTHLEDSAGSYV